MYIYLQFILIQSGEREREREREICILIYILYYYSTTLLQRYTYNSVTNNCEKVLNIPKENNGTLKRIRVKNSQHRDGKLLISKYQITSIQLRKIKNQSFNN